MEHIKCKDYFIVKIRVYADEKILDKWRLNKNSPTPKQHWERAKQYNEFFWLFVETITKKSRTFWNKEFLMSSRECVEDEIADKYNIHIFSREAWMIYLIPKENIELFKWVKKNLKNPFKVLKKTMLGFWCYREISTWRRDQSKKFTIETNEKKKI